MTARLTVKDLSKRFVLHQQGSAELQVLDSVSFSVNAGECLALSGPSGSGKSTLMRLLYANYRAQQGEIVIRDSEHRNIDLVRASDREKLHLRKTTVGYVSQFLRVIPRISCLALVMEPLRQRGVAVQDAESAAAGLLSRLNISSKLWTLAPSTFSGGEQQRVNIARGFVAPFPLLLLDEPTASLDAENRQVVTGLILEAKSRGVAIVGIFHDQTVRECVADTTFQF